MNDINKIEQETKERFIIISSWAVKLWKNKVIERWWSVENISNSSLASIWQQYLMQMYDRLSWDRLVGQILLDDYINVDYVNSFVDKKNNRKILKRLSTDILWLVSAEKDKHLAQTISDLVRNQVLVIINHNDTTSNDELKNLSNKTDNDKNTIHITEVLNKYANEINLKIHRVIFLTNTNWLLDVNWDTVIWWKVDLSDVNCRENYLSHIETKKSNNGTWWMDSKVNCAFEVLEKGATESIIANSSTWLKCLSIDDYSSTRFKI